MEWFYLEKFKLGMLWPSQLLEKMGPPADECFNDESYNNYGDSKFSFKFEREF